MAQGKKGRKVGRAKRNGQNARYINERRQPKSHLRRIKKHLKRFPDDLVAQKMKERYELLC